MNTIEITAKGDLAKAVLSYWNQLAITSHDAPVNNTHRALASLYKRFDSKRVDSMIDKLCALEKSNVQGEYSIVIQSDHEDSYYEGLYLALRDEDSAVEQRGNVGGNWRCCSIGGFCNGWEVIA